jgi:hypothetical protein
LPPASALVFGRTSGKYREIADGCKKNGYFRGTCGAGSGQARTASSWLRRGFSAMKSLAWFVGSGMKRVPSEVYQARRNTCQDCEHHTGLRCKLCGCFTSVKAWMPHEECPIGKWPTDLKSLRSIADFTS